LVLNRNFKPRVAIRGTVADQLLRVLQDIGIFSPVRSQSALEFRESNGLTVFLSLAEANVAEFKCWLDSAIVVQSKGLDTEKVNVAFRTVCNEAGCSVGRQQ